MIPSDRTTLVKSRKSVVVVSGVPRYHRSLVGLSSFIVTFIDFLFDSDLNVGRIHLIPEIRFTLSTLSLFILGPRKMYYLF